MGSSGDFVAANLESIKFAAANLFVAYAILATEGDFSAPR
jgi:hypothetical protein